MSGDPGHPGVRKWSTEWNLSVFEQRGADLGERMANAAARILARDGACLIVGVDCPGIDAAYVSNAARVLRTTDLVLAPAEDGGYGLIGLRQPAPELFHGVAWGRQTVLKETLDRASLLGLEAQILDTVWDVDDAADWARFLESGCG